MDFVYAAVIVSLWACEALIAYHILNFLEEKKAEREASGKSSWVIPMWLEEAIEGVIAIPVGLGLLALPLFVISLITNHAQEQLRDSQWANCANTQNTDGEYLTKKQCEYFRDVLNGKYVDLDTTMYSPRNFDD